MNKFVIILIFIFHFASIVSCQQSKTDWIHSPCNEGPFTIRYNLTVDSLHECDFFSLWERWSKNGKTAPIGFGSDKEEEINIIHQQRRYVQYTESHGNDCYIYDWQTHKVHLRIVYQTIDQYSDKAFQKFLFNNKATVIKEITDSTLLQKELKPLGGLERIIFTQQNNNIFKLYMFKLKGDKENPYREIEVNYNFNKPYTLDYIEKNYGTNRRKKKDIL